jgi:hypothetical protein
MLFSSAGLVLFHGCGKQQLLSQAIVPEPLPLATEEDLCISTGIRFPVDFSLYTPLYHCGSEPSKKIKLMLYAEGSLSVADVIRYYQHTLAADGWFIEDLSHANEGLLRAKKARRRVFIAIRPHDVRQERTVIRYLVYRAASRCRLKSSGVMSEQSF